MNAKQVVDELISIGNPVKANNSMRFFKTGPGHYGEGDKFIGVTVPEQRVIAKKFSNLPLAETIKLLKSAYHECRLTALFILVGKYNNGSPEQRQEIYDLYMENTKWINNWDLVDSSASYIVGQQLGSNYSKVLKKLAKSGSLWERRIAIIATLYYISKGNPKPALEIIEILKYDSHDLIQKAVGWMLREIGKRCSRDILRNWLLNDKQYSKLPRTTLRYAIEHFSDSDRKSFLRGEL